MTNIAQQNLHFELSDRNNKDCFKTVISKDFTPYSKHLNSLKNSFEEEVERNLQEFNNYPLAYKYIKEVFYDFEMLRKYYFNSIYNTENNKHSEFEDAKPTTVEAGVSFTFWRF